MNNTLLIIEDNPDNFYLMKFLLEKNNFNIIGADNGIDGIEMANNNEILAILLDIQLPEIDGYEVARRLRKNPNLDLIPIIAVTSYAMVGDKEQAFKVGANGYIEKPINPDTFVSEIVHYINKGV